jgi:DnaJ-class molecular chaperone
MNEETHAVKTLTPENFAQRCPVCNGHGNLNYGRKVCHGCQGKGFLILPVAKIISEEEGENTHAGNHR